MRVKSIAYYQASRRSIAIANLDPDLRGFGLLSVVYPMQLHNV